LNSVLVTEPELNPGERKLLFATHKRLVRSTAAKIRVIVVPLFMKEDDVNAVPERVGQLNLRKNDLIAELDAYCNECVELIENRLLSSTSDDLTRVVCERVKGGFHRYSTEFKSGCERAEAITKAQMSYESALAIGCAVLDLDDADYLRAALRNARLL
jgi:hypothetical protein